MTKSDSNESRHQEFVANSVLLFFVAAAGIGFTIIGLTELGSIPFEVAPMEDATVEEIEEFESELFSELAMDMLLFSLFLTPIFGAVVGIWAGGSFERVNDSVLLAGVGSLIGGFIFANIVGSLSFIAMTEEFREALEIQSLSFSSLLMNAILAGIGAAIIAAGTAYAAN